jgi:hypothetical protein
MDKQEKIQVFREKFFGRQDIYAKHWEYKKPDGTLQKGLAPKCSNFWTDVCHIKNKTNITCTKCENKKYDPISDESTWNHITGRELSSIYLVLDDGMIRFAALDFDYKEGREKEGYTFEDVKLVCHILSENHIPHAVARSTTSGYHLYLFFKDPYPAYKFRSCAYWIFEKVGFMEQVRQGIRPLCEIFPKQDYTGGFGPGNGIKVPMVEPRWEYERNGFVDLENRFIDPSKQWEYLKSTPYIESSVMEAFISRNGIIVEDEDIADTGTPSFSEVTRRVLKRNHIGSRGWEQPLSGSFEKVVEGCAALRRVAQKEAAGNPITHNEGFAAYHLAMKCADGLEVFAKKIPSWGKTEKDQRQLEHSLEKNYSPWTCLKMQENGVCVPGTKCFEKKPPLTLVEGHYVSQSNVPESEWPEPSPIRYAFGKGEDFLEKLKKEADELVKEADENVKGSSLRNLIRRAQVFDEDQQRSLKDYIKSKKIIKAGDLTKFFNKAHLEHSKALKEKASLRSDTVVVGKNTYHLDEGNKCYSMMKTTKEGPIFERISNCIISIEEEINYLDDDTTIQSVYKGSFYSVGMTSSFEIDQADWWDANKFISFFGRFGGSNCNILKEDVGYVRQAALAFAGKTGITKQNNLVTQGWYQGTYLMPSALIDVDGIRPNTETLIDLSGKTHASFLDFKILPDEEFRSLGFHIMNEFLNAWPRSWSMIALAHALLPAVVNPMGIRKKPSLFFEGLTGSGKTELVQTTQFFWGEFDAVVNLASTGRGLMAVAHDFKDALVVFDDYKGLNPAQLSALQTIIQYSYDPNSAVKLNRDSSLRRATQSRGVISFTGEHFLENDAAMVARSIIVEAGKQDTSKTKDLYLKCIDRRKFYNGITPRFIHWFLSKDLAVLKESLTGLTRSFHAPVSGMQNADRISYNTALNHFMWSLFANFMEENGIIISARELISEHLKYITEIQQHMLFRCGEEQNGLVFLRVLVQLILSREVRIDGFTEQLTSDTFKPLIGWVRVDASGEKVLNIYPDVAFKVIKSHAKESPIRGTVRELGNQFQKGGFLTGADDKRFKRQVRHEGARVYVWPFDMKKLGFSLSEFTND